MLTFRAIRRMLVFTVCLVVNLAPPAHPAQINFQGKLTSPGGQPLDTTLTFVFTIFEHDGGGQELWEEVRPGIVVTNGTFSVILGEIQGIPADIFRSTTTRYLGIKPGDDPELTPRTPLVSVARACASSYAWTATNAESVVDGCIELADFADFGASEGQILKWQGGAWTLAADAVGGGGFTLPYAGIAAVAPSFQVTFTGETGAAVYGLATDNSPSATNYGGYFESHGPNGSGVFGTSDGGTSHGVHGVTSSTYGSGVYGYGSGSSATGVTGISDYSDGVYGHTNNMVHSGVYGHSSVGIGVTGRCDGQNHGVFGASFSTDTTHAGVFGRNNGAGAGVYGEANGPNAPGVYGVSYEGRGVIGITSDDNEWTPAIYGKNIGLGDGVYGWSQSRHGTVGVTYSSNVNHAAVWAKNNGQGMGLYAEAGTISPWAAVFKGNVQLQSKSTGATIVELGEGLDYAEGFDVSGSDRPEPGTVLSIDSDQPGRLQVSACAYDSRVAGIVAGAHGLGSGVKLGVGQFDCDVALAGRVYCKVDASYGRVRPGDLLTTSPTPGYAMLAEDTERASGTILGKAMEGLDQGQRGRILVLVTLQ